jgi:hypothetical protein
MVFVELSFLQKSERITALTPHDDKWHRNLLTTTRPIWFRLYEVENNYLYGENSAER